MTKIYAIFDTQESKFVMMRSGEYAWPYYKDAKLAYARHMGPTYRKPDKPKYDEQDRYEIVELAESYFRLKDLED